MISGNFTICLDVYYFLTWKRFSFNYLAVFIQWSAMFLITLYLFNRCFLGIYLFNFIVYDTCWNCRIGILVWFTVWAYLNVGVLLSINSIIIPQISILLLLTFICRFLIIFWCFLGNRAWRRGEEYVVKLEVSHFLEGLDSRQIIKFLLHFLR